MQSDNLDTFEKLVFSIPPTPQMLAINIFASLLFGAATFAAIESFTTVQLNLFQGVSLILFIYLIPAIITAETLKTFLPNFKRNWGLMLAVGNQTVLLLFSIIITGADTVASAWSILWLGMITVYMITFLVLTVVAGTEYLKRIGFLSLVQPITILAAFHLFLGRRLLIPMEIYLLNFLLLLVGGALLVTVVFVVEYLIGSNVSNISAFDLTSALVQNKDQGLDLGYPAEPDVQTLQIDNGEEFTLAAPWVHPGPIAGFGGGDLTQYFIEKLNENGEGFFLHVPSTHHADLVNPEDKDELYKALDKPEKSSKASKLIKEDIGFGTIYGRAFGDQNIIYIDIYDYDDYDMSIFRESVDLEKTMVIDLHREDNGERKEMYYSTSIADKVERKMKEFEERLEQLDQEEYQAGKAVGLNHRAHFVTLEKVGDQKVLIAGFANNGIPEELREVELEMKEEYDEVLFLSTDTHSSLKEMVEMEKYDPKEFRKTVQKAEDNLSDAEIGFINKKAGKVSVLREDYQGLIFSINILIRLLPIALILLYLGLVIWVL